MANKQCIQRLLREYKQIQKDPPPYIVGRPDEENVQVWYYIIKGPPDSPYEGGVYMGKVRFPDEYPFAPPSIMMCTPSGRFKPDSRLCFSMTDFHPKEWNPSWGPSSILKGLLSFMLEDTQTYGSVETSVEYKKKMAIESHAFNLKLPAFVRLFPAEKEECELLIAKQNSPSASSLSSAIVAAACGTQQPAGGSEKGQGEAEPTARDEKSTMMAAAAASAPNVEMLFGCRKSNVLKFLQIIFVLLVALAMMYVAQKSSRKRTVT